MTANGIVYVVGGDGSSRDALRVELETHSPWLVRCVGDENSWLDAAPHLEPGCVLLDLAPVEGEGAGVLTRMNARGSVHKAVMLSDHGRIASTVSAMKAGAVDVVEKPATWAVLAPSITAALHQLCGCREQLARKRRALALVERLSVRERDVMLAMIEGLPNKLIAYRLGLSPRTVEVHRASLMTKMEMGSLADVLKCALAAGLLEG